MENPKLNIAIVTAYCHKFGLHVAMPHEDPSNFEPEEWDDCALVGLVSDSTSHDPYWQGSGVIFVSDDGEIRVTVNFADGTLFMEDQQRVVSHGDVALSIASGRPLHATD